jgi:hypothetical protein
MYLSLKVKNFMYLRLKVKKSMYLGLKVKNSMWFLVSIYHLPLGLRVKKKLLCTSFSENDKTPCTAWIQSENIPAAFI